MWLDMQTHICIFESLQLEGSYVGELLYWDTSDFLYCGQHYYFGSICTNGLSTFVKLHVYKYLPPFTLEPSPRSALTQQRGLKAFIRRIIVFAWEKSNWTWIFKWNFVITLSVTFRTLKWYSSHKGLWLQCLLGRLSYHQVIPLYFL